MLIPDPVNSIAALIDKAHQDRQEKPRPHMGCSMLGHPCDRYLWLSFRWAVVEKFAGRILRLFRRGQLEENTITQDLRAIGIDIRATAGAQSKVDFGCHVSGSVDGVIYHGVPEALNKKHIAEFKTHSKKSFDDLGKQGVEKSKPMHFVQMQVYMLGTQIDRALYLAINKDNDEIYTERVRLDKPLAEKYVERGKRVALSDRMPPPLSTDPTWYQCKFCPSHNFCHVSKITKEVNCRTCAHSTAKDDGTWHCARWDDAIPTQAQYAGCDSHVLHPDLVPYQLLDGDGINGKWLIDGKEVINGEAGYHSSEILVNPAVLGDARVDEIRKEFGARIVA